MGDAMALTSTNSVKLYLGITSNAEDPFFDATVIQVDALIKRYLGQNIESASYTEYYGGNNDYCLALRQGPVTAITSVHLDAYGFYGMASDPFPSGTALTAGVDYAFAGGRRLMRLNGVWPGIRRRTAGMLSAALEPALGNIKVVYTAGYASVPADLTLAANILVGLIRQDREQGGGTLTSESYEGYSYSLQRAESYLGQVRHLLAPYRMMRL